MPAVVVLAAVAGCVSTLACRPKPRPEDLHKAIAADIRRGNLQSAERRFKRLPSAWANDPSGEWFWRFRILRAQLAISEGKYDDAAAALRDPVQSVAARDELEAARGVQLAYINLFRRRYDAATRLLDEAMARAPAVEQVQLEARVARSVLVSNTKPMEDADRALEEALTRAQKAGDLYFQAAVLNNFGAVRLNRFRYDEAIPYFERALDAARRTEADLLASSIIGNLSVCAYKLGDSQRAMDLRAQAADLQRKVGADAKLQVSLGEFGNMSYMRGDPAGAIQYFSQALEIARRLRDPQWIALWNLNLARAYVDTRQWDAAERAQKEIVDLGFAQPGGRFEPAVRLNEALIKAGRGDTGEAIELYRKVIRDAGDNTALLWQAYAHLGELHLKSGQTAQANTCFEAALSAIHKTRAAILQRDYKITFLDSLIRFYRRYVDTLVEQGRYEKALAVADSSRALLLEERFGLSERPPADSSGFQSIAAAAGATLLSYWVAPERSFVWVVTSSAIRVFVLPGAQEISRLARSHAKAITDLRDPLAIAHPASLALSRILLGPILPFVPAGSKVIVIPDGALFDVNLETLPAGDHYWIRDVTMAVAPSISILRKRRGPEHGRGSALLLIGDPAYSGSDIPKLEFALQEVEQIREAMAGHSVTTFSQAEARPSAYSRTVPARFRFIHFAAHAVSNPASPLDSAILLAPDSASNFKLYARQVLDVPLTAELVTISACRSAGARAYSGEGLVGLAWSFLHAGARNVIGGLWDVNDDSTAELMATLYRDVRKGSLPVEALRSAKLSLLGPTAASNGRRGKAYGMPFFWAPFQTYVSVSPWTSRPSNQIRADAGPASQPQSYRTRE